MDGTRPSRLLEIKDLKVSFSQGKEHTLAVDGISFEMLPSETLAIVGESGSGKSVTALSVMKLIPDPPGKVEAEKMNFFIKDNRVINLQTASEPEMTGIRGKEIAMVFQEPMTSLNPVFTCGDQVCEGIRSHFDITKTKAVMATLELFREVKLPQPDRIFRAYPHQLSGGQKQRIMIAIAVSCNPSLLIADEPTTALDVTVQKKILQLLKKIQRIRKMGILFITHDLGLVSGFANRVMVMYKGKIVEQGSVSQIFNNPEHPYTQGLLACRPPLNARLKRLPTVADFIEGRSKTCVEVLSEEERSERLARLYKSEPVLKVRDLVKQFPGTRAVDKVSFNVFRGETLGIVGESGSGKTTLARVVLELIPPDSGKILFKNEEITRIKKNKLKSLRKDLQIIFQDPYSSLNPRLTAGAAILEPMKVHHLHDNDKARKAKVVELLGKVGLEPEHLNRYPHEFSGGQRQRICIARALAVEPQLLICDESVSALDVSVQAQVLNLLNDLKKEFGLTYIFISHDLSVVRYMADRIIVMNSGRILETGDADRIFTNPHSTYTSSLIEAIPHPEFLQ
ncbi:MAG: ABC transporter ATP-binding protein [Bacteroidetes bacterium]|nr:ABC transporter ATP-binding protein [Bacteroidota bacterium]